MSGTFADLPEARRRGLEKMEQVYGFDMTDGVGDFFRHTADHLSGDIWPRPGPSDRDRRLLLLGRLPPPGAPRRPGRPVHAAPAHGSPRHEDPRGRAPGGGGAARGRSPAAAW